MFSDVSGFRRLLGAAAVATVAWASPCWAQVTPAAGYVPPDDTPSIRVGVTIFADYTYQDTPEVKDADGNSVHLNSFNVSRAYINVTGQINHYIAFRVTPDITRETDAGSSIDGSYTYRLKYAFAQFNFDDWMPRGSWARFGLQQTPYVDYAEGIYRYRFQGTIFAEREGFLTSSDNAASFHYNFATELRRHPRRHLQRRGVLEARGQRHEGLPDPRNRASAAQGEGPARAAVHRVFRWRRLRQERRKAAQHLRHHVRASLRQPFVRVHGHQGSNVLPQERHGREGLVLLGEPEDDEGLGGAAALRPFRARRQHQPEARASDRRHLVLVPAPGQRRDGASARLRQRDLQELHTGPGLRRRRSPCTAW